MLQKVFWNLNFYSFFHLTKSCSTNSDHLFQFMEIFYIELLLSVLGLIVKVENKKAKCGSFPLRLSEFLENKRMKHHICK